MELSINLKIQAKDLIHRYGRVISLNTAKDLNMFYDTFNQDTFLLPYKVQKLSKRARRNNC